MLGLKPALPRVLSFPRNPRVLMHAQTIFITETDDATAKTERGWYMVASSAGEPYENTINPVSGLKAMLDKRHLAVAGKFMTLLTLPDGTTQWSSAIPPRPNTKDAVQFVMKLDITTANGVGPGTSGWARKMDEDLVGNLRYPGGVRVVSVDGDEDGNMYVSYEGCTGYNATAPTTDRWGRPGPPGMKERCTKRLAKLWAVNGSEAWEVDARTTQRNATPAHCVWSVRSCADTARRAVLHRSRRPSSCARAA